MSPQKQHYPLVKPAFILLLLFVSLSSFAEETANLPTATPGGAQFMNQYPDSDANSDGILTAEEKEAFCIAETINRLGGGYTYRREMIPMRDGVHLATAIFIPESEGPFSTLMSRTGYGIWAAALFDTANYANENLVYICQDLRGDGESEGAGTFDPKSFDNEINDGYDTIDWVATQEWSNGKVGIHGQSGHGFAAYMAYLSNHPNLSAVSTNVSGGSAHLYWTFHNGVEREMYKSWIPQRNVTIPQWPRPTIEPFDRKAYAQTVAAAAKDNPATFIAITGWYDIFAESALDYFRDFAQDGKVFVLVNPSGHGNMGGEPYPPTPVPAEWELPKITDVLKDAAPDRKSQMVYYLMGDVDDPTAPGNCYKTTDVWPVPHTPVSYYLHPNATLITTPPTEPKAALPYLYDPRKPVPSVGGDVFIHNGVGPLDQRVLHGRADILQFTSAPLEAPLEITGKITADLYVSSNVEDTTFTAKLIDFYPDGHQAIVRDSIIMGRYHKGFDQEHPMKPGEVYKLTLDLWSTALVVNKGHRLSVQISSSNSPKYAVHPNTFEPVDSYDNSPIAINTIHLSPEHPSRIVLPVVTE